MYLRRLQIAAGALFLSLVAPMAAHAQVGSLFCGTIAPDPIVLNGTFNPFGGSPLTLTQAMTVTSNATKPTEIDFLIYQPVGDNTAYTMTNGNGENVLFPAGTPVPIGTPHNVLVAQFQGQNSVANPFNLNIGIPANAQPPAGTNQIAFDVGYSCKFTGNSRTTGTVNGAIIIQFTVVSGLQASFAGTSLDFGNITTVTNAQAPSHTVSGQINVKSDAPYTVAVSSPNGFMMTPGGTTTAQTTQQVGYKLGFLGQTPQGTSGGPSSTFTTVTCNTASMAGVSIPITTTLTEGGVGKASGSYKDTISVTFTPLNTTTGNQNCP